MAKSGSPQGERAKKIGPYEVIKRIGAGGMGTVYLAKDSDLGRMVALKVLPAELATKTEMIGRFRQEAQHAAKLRHENIVTLYGCGDHKGTPYLAMEYVEGCNLHEFIDKKGKLSPEDARILMVQAAKALICAHEQGIVHRDIKPSNFLLAVTNSRPVVKLTDFGLARTVDDFDGKMTRTGTTVGTVDYISPEQARNSRAADIRSDIYSLGCTFYHMLAGRPPFPDGDLTERLLKHVEAEPPDILKFNPQTPPGLVQILKKMLAKKPEDRYQNPSELLEALANPPKGPAISPREALELLAEASGEKARSTRPSALAETRRQIKELTAALPANLPPAGADLKLHYRKKKNERRKRPEKTDAGTEELTAPLVLEGLGPWLAVIGGITAVALIAMAILFKWGGRVDAPKPEDEQTAAKESETVPEKHEINQQTKKMVSDVKKEVEKRREGEDPAASRAAIEAMRAAREIPEIEVPGEKVRDEMVTLFPKESRASATKNLEEISKFNPSSAGPAPNANPPTREPSAGQPSAHPSQSNPPPTGGRSEPRPPQTLPKRGPQGEVATPPRADGPGSTSGRAQGQSKSGDVQSPGGDKSIDPKSSAAGQTTTPPSKQSSPGNPAPSNNQSDIAGARPGAAPNGRIEPRIVRVRRGADGSTSGTYGSIAQALAAGRLLNAPVVVEIKDNGPFFESGLEIKNQSVVLRGADGFRPLIALAPENSSGGSRFLVAIQNGNLVLENIDLVLKPSDAQQDVDTGLIRLGEGNLLLEDCSMSLAGRTRDGSAAIRFDGVPAGTGLAHCWLRRCFVRGADMTAVDIRGPGCSVTADGCLLVGHERPLLAIRGQSANKPTDIKIARSTLVGGQSLCQIEATSAREADAQVQLVLWDSLLARSGTTEGGAMLRFGPGAPLSTIHWRAVNCLYTGWQTLLQYAGGKVAGNDLAGWHSLLHQQGGDKSLPLSWPPYFPPETDRIPPAPFRTAGTATAFRDSTGKGFVGCPVQDLPPTRLAWPSYTYDRAAVPALDTRVPDRAPEIPHSNDGRYHGGRVDVSRTDLGEHLQKLQDAGQLANRVVIHLSGRGIAPVTPFRLKDVHLILYADPAAGPATLSPKSGATADALMSFENGGCELIGVHFGMPPGDKNAEIGSFVQTKNATLRVLGCRMKSVAAKNAVRTLIAFTGSGDSALERSSDCVIADCILQASGWILKMSGNGSLLRVQNSLLVAGEDAIVYEPGTLGGPLDLHCVLDHDTIAARRAAVRVQDQTAGVVPLDSFPVQTRGCVFLNPFGELPIRAGLLALEDQALPHGLVSWQADGNAYDKQLGYAMASSDRGRESLMSAESCATIWGPLADRRGMIFDGATRDFKIEQPALERLNLPATVRAKFKGTPPGADFEQLGIGKR